MARRKVFVSHSSEDKWVARHIVRAIEACGCEAFLDEAGVEVGERFEEPIRSFLRETDELVVLLTPWALTRPYIWAELGMAWGRDIPIVALLHGLEPRDLQARPEIPVFIKERNAVKLNDIDRYLNDLRRRSQAPR